MEKFFQLGLDKKMIKYTIGMNYMQKAVDFRKKGEISNTALLMVCDACAVIGKRAGIEKKYFSSAVGSCAS